MLPLIDVGDRLSAPAATLWERHGAAWPTARYANWTRSQRTLLNRGSSGSAVYLLGLTSASPQRWQAGDLVEILPRNSPWAIEHFLAGLGLAGDEDVQIDGLAQTLNQALATRQLPANRAHLVGLHAQALVNALAPLGMREYSIASIASDGVLELIVRQERHPDGGLGLGSGWLTEHAAIGSAISLRLRRNSGFHLPDAPVPLILLGNGTGLAGLRSGNIHIACAGKFQPAVAVVFALIYGAHGRDKAPAVAQ